LFAKLPSPEERGAGEEAERRPCENRLPTNVSATRECAADLLIRVASETAGKRPPATISALRVSRRPNCRGALVKVLGAHIEVLKTQLAVAETRIKQQAAEFAARDEKARLSYAALGEKLRAAKKLTTGRGLWWSLIRR
jgi:hypothetical protein